MPIQPGEGRRVLIALAVYFLVMGGLMLGRNARDSLFLKNFGIQYLPYMYAANAVFVVGAAVFYSSFVDRLERVRFLTYSYITFVLLLGVSRAMLGLHYHWFYPVLYLVVQSIWILSVMVFWTFVGDLFDTRQAKRLFPVVGIGGLLGMIGVGLFNKPVIRAVGSANLFFVWMIALTVALILMRAARPSEATAEEASPHPARAREATSLWRQLREGLLYLRSAPLLRAMAGIMVMLSIVYVIVDFQFNRTMNETYPTQDALTSFLGTFVGIAGFLSLLSQLFLTPFLISRFGVGATILIHPAALTGLTLLMSLLPGYSTVFAAKIIDHVALYTVQDSSFQLLYNPVPLDRRGRVRAFIEGYFKPLMTGVAGVLLLAARWLKPTPAQISMMAVVLAVVWLVFALRVKKSYVTALIDNLHGESPALRVAAADALARLKDPDSFAILKHTLQTGEPQVVAFAIQFIERFRLAEAQELVLPLLDHQQPIIRATAVASLARIRSPRLREEFPRLLEDPNPRVRANTVEALAEYLDDVLVPFVRAKLNDPAPRVRANAIAVLAAHAEGGVAEETLAAAQEMVASPDANERSAAAYALGRVPRPTSFALLVKLLADVNETVAGKAARALVNLGEPGAVPALLGRIGGYRTLRRHIRRAVAELAQKYPDAVLEGIEGALADPARASARVDFMKILGRLPHARVPEILLGQLEREVGKAQASVLRALERQAKLKPLPEGARLTIHRYVGLELEQYAQYQRWQRALPTNGLRAERLLALSLREETGFVVERVFDGLALLYGPDMHRVARQILTGNPRSRANAFELIETLLPKDFSQRLLQGLEPSARVQQAPADISRAVTLEELLKHPKPWLRACAAYAVGEGRLEEFGANVERLLDDESGIVREAALNTLWTLRGEQVIDRVRAAVEDPDLNVHRQAKTILRNHSTPASD